MEKNLSVTQEKITGYTDKNAGKRNGRIKKLIEKEIKIYG